MPENPGRWSWISYLGLKGLGCCQPEMNVTDGPATLPFAYALGDMQQRSEG